MVFDLQRFAGEDADPQAQAQPVVGDATPQQTASQPEAGTQDATGSGQTGQQPATQPMFTQEQVNEIVERRLARERRKWEQELAELRRQVQQIPQAVPSPNQREQAQQFLAEFARDPYGALERFAQAWQARQTQQVQSVAERIRTAIQDASEALASRYPDFAQHSTAVATAIQTDPVLLAAYQRISRDPDPAAYQAIMEAAYLKAKAQYLGKVQTVSGAQVAQEQQALSAAKARAAAPVQKVAAATKQPVEQDPEDILLQEMKKVR